MPIRSKWLSRLAGSVVIALVGACNVLDVESPGNIADKDLNTFDAIPGIVTGMSYDLSRAVNTINYLTALSAGELYHAGSYSITDIAKGTILPEDINTEWSRIMKARWTAEHGIERIRGILSPEDFAKNAHVARAYLLAGLANRTIGENVCQTVIDAGAPQPNTVEFDRGIANFTKAIEIGTAAHDNDVVTAAYAGRASLRAWKGSWSGANSAAEDAAKVPADFVYLAALMTDGYFEGAGNDIAYETHDRYEYSVWSTEFANHYGDPRIPWDTVYKADHVTIAVGANGATPVFRQEKYQEIGDDIPLVKGTEMLVLRAEAALRSNDIPGAYALMNLARDEYGMPHLTVATTAAQAWADLRYERGATTWLETRRLWDARRWFAESGPAHSDILLNRDKCMPISKDEATSNPNIP